MNDSCSLADCEQPRVIRGWCRKHYQRWRKQGDPTKLGRPHDSDVRLTDAYRAELFWQRVDRRGGPDACWPWLGGAQSQGGRGRIIVNGRKIYAYRRAWELTHGVAIPDHLLACHHCDNPNCVNPAHIFIGTEADNSRDAAVKGISRGPAPKGRKYPDDRVPPAVIAAAIAEYRRGGVTQQQIADRLGVAQATVSDWHLGKRRPDARLGGAA